MVSAFLIFALLLAPAFARLAGIFIELAGSRRAGLFGIRRQTPGGFTGFVGGGVGVLPFAFALGVALLPGLAGGQKHRNHRHRRNRHEALCAQPPRRGTRRITDRVNVRAGLVGIGFRDRRESGRIGIWIGRRQLWFHARFICTFGTGDAPRR